jgi:superfamily II DNA helicase RecQ
VRSNTTGAAAVLDDAPPVDEEQFSALREWRMERAEGLPAYTVATNAVLEEVLYRRPGSVEELIEIRGVGPSFCEKHGESLLAALASLERGAGEVDVRATQALGAGPG